MAVHVDSRGTIALVTMDRREALNAFDSEQLQTMLDAVNQISRDERVRAVVLTGAGDRSFAAGADIKEMSTKTPDEAVAFSRLGHAVANAIAGSPVPWIAAVNGYAFGGGCEIALACNIRLAGENAVFAQPEVGLGVPPGWGATQRLPRIVGPGRAAEIVLTGQWVRAAEALTIGLVNAVHPPEELLDHALTLAETIAKNGPQAVRTTKQLIARAIDDVLETGLEAEIEAFAGSFGTDEQREGMLAFIEKREPEFSSREQVDDDQGV